MFLVLAFWGFVFVCLLLFVVFGFVLFWVVFFFWGGGGGGGENTQNVSRKQVSIDNSAHCYAEIDIAEVNQSLMPTKLITHFVVWYMVKMEGLVK